MTECEVTTNYMVTLVRQVISALVDDALGVEIRAEAASTTTGTIYVRVAQGDLGKVIGKQGRTARSLRTIIGGAGRKHGIFFDLVINPGTL